MLILYPTLRANVQWLGPVITRFATEKREVWLTIDDGPTEDTPAVLELFRSRGVKATFFVKGTRAAASPSLVQAMLDGGHIVANHSHTHPSGTFWCAPPGRIAFEVDECQRTIAQFGKTRPWFRAPVGMKNPFVHPLLSRRGLRLIGWSARGFDGVVSDANAVIERILPDLSPGAIIMMHQGGPQSLAMLTGVIDAVQAQGYAFVIPEDGALRA
ncbi:MAG TPA: polysaccharide deacetylase family protein [Thermoanaerobaculia bacterium]